MTTFTKVTARALLLGVVICSAVSAACKSSPTGPSDTPPSTSAHVTAVTALLESTATVSAVLRSGSPPASAGGPTATVTSSAEATPGNPNLVLVRTTTPIQTVFLSVASASNPSDASDHYQFMLPEPSTSVKLAVTYPSSIPSSTFTLRVQVAAANGPVGPIVVASKTVATTAVELVGIVYAGWIGTPGPPVGPSAPDPVQGATVSTSLDSRTAVTDANGLFDLKTGVASDACFTITVSAPGLPSYIARRRGGSSAIVAYTLGSTPQYPIPSPCS